MILALQVVNIILIGGMAIVLLLIIGVVGALRGSQRSLAPAHALDDPPGIDLDDRLRKVTLAVTQAAAEAPRDLAPVGAAIGRPALERPADSSYRTDSSASEPPVPLAPPVPPTARLALPDTATLRSAGAGLSAPTISEGLSPLAARFTSPERGMGEGPLPPSLPRPTGSLAGKLPELPGTVTTDLSMPGFAARTRDESAAFPPALPPSSGHLGLPGTVADGFTMEPEPASPPALTPSASTRPALPSSGMLDRGFTGDLPEPHSARRPELPGTVEQPDEPMGNGAFGSPAFDIRAILRGEAAPRGALPAASGFGGDPGAPPLKPTFTTGPLPPLPPLMGRRGPIGAVAFDPGLLELRMLEPGGGEAISSRLTSMNLSLDRSIAAGPTTYESTGVTPVPIAEPAVDLDATRIMDDFDLPDTGFETHVFSTAELIEDESFTQPPPGMLEITEEAALPAPGTPIAEYAAEPEEPAPIAQETYAQAMQEPAPEPAILPLGDRTILPMAQEEEAWGHLEELANLLDVSFVKLIAADGSVMLEAGTETADAHTNGTIAALVATAAMEARQLDLGEWGSIAVESAGAALLLSPVVNGAVLAVLLSNPSRLGLLRRQVRKPLGGLRTLLQESSVS